MPIISGGSGGSGSGTVLFSSTLGSPASTIDSGAGGFSTSLSILTIYLVLRTNDAGTGAGSANITFNNDSGANYNQQSLSGNNASAAAAQSLARNNFAFSVNSAGDTASDVSIIQVIVPLYGGTTFNKSCVGMHFQSSATTGLLVTAERGCVWGSTSAISRVAVGTGGAGTYNTGCAMLIYGQ